MNSIRNIDYKMNEFDFDKTLITIHKRTIKNNQKYYSILTSLDCSLNMHNKCYVNHMMFKFRKKNIFVVRFYEQSTMFESCVHTIERISK